MTKSQLWLGVQVAVEINRLRAQTTALLNRCLQRARLPGMSGSPTAAAMPMNATSDLRLATEVVRWTIKRCDFATLRTAWHGCHRILF